MALVPTVNSLQNEINRLFESMVNRTGDFEGDEMISEWAPRVDVVEQEDHYRIVADLPGMKRENIHVNVERNTLSISGERNQVEEKKGERWYRRERTSGTFKRVFSLPETVDPDNVSAEYKDGELTVTVPKAPGAKPRLIEIKSADKTDT